jgi:cytochrome c6
MSLTVPLMLDVSTRAWAADPGKGSAIYSQHCVVCHGDRGEGVMPGAPDFSRGDGLMQPDRVLADSITNGKLVMPAFQGLLRDDEILDVIAYIRTMR